MERQSADNKEKTERGDEDGLLPIIVVEVAITKLSDDSTLRDAGWRGFSARRGASFCEEEKSSGDGF